MKKFILLKNNFNIQCPTDLWLRGKWSYLFSFSHGDTIITFQAIKIENGRSMKESLDGNFVVNVLFLYSVLIANNKKYITPHPSNN